MTTPPREIRRKAGRDRQRLIEEPAPHVRPEICLCTCKECMRGHHGCGSKWCHREKGQVL